MSLYLIALAVYSLLMIALGAMASRRVKGSSDFFVAGRRLGAGYLAATLIAANIGAGSTVGAAGLGYRDGLSAWWWVGSAGIGSLILALTLGPRLWAVAEKNNLFTVGDYLEHRYDSGVRNTAAIFLWAGSLVILSGQLIAVAWILNVVAGVSKPAGCILAAFVCTIYFVVGGLHSTVRVNLLQSAVKIVGFSVALVFALEVSGGLHGVTEAVRTRLGGESAQSYFSFSGGSVSRYLITVLPSFVVSPGILQKVFGARDKKSVRLGVGINAAVLLLFAAGPVVLGMIARARLDPLVNRELALPSVITQVLPAWLGTLLLAAIFSAEISAADAVLFMLTTSLGKDLYKGRLKPDASDEDLLRFTRWCAAAAGIVGVVCALALETVISALTIFYSIITAVFLLPIVCGLYWPGAAARAVKPAIWITVAVLFLLEAGPRLASHGVVPGPVVSVLGWPFTRWNLPPLLLALAAGVMGLAVKVALDKNKRES